MGRPAQASPGGAGDGRGVVVGWLAWWALADGVALVPAAAFGWRLVAPEAGRVVPLVVLALAAWLARMGSKGVAVIGREGWYVVEWRGLRARMRPLPAPSQVWVRGYTWAGVPLNGEPDSHGVFVVEAGDPAAGLVKVWAAAGVADRRPAERFAARLRLMGGEPS